MNEYRIFYLKDLIPLIDRIAMETLMVPHITEQPNASGIWNEMNASIAVFNEGVRSMAVQMLNELEKEGEDDGA